MTDPKFSPEEIENSKRIFKSATPKYTIDWYLKNKSYFRPIKKILINKRYGLNK